MKRISGEDEFRFSFGGYRLPYKDDWRRQYNFYYQGCEFKTDKSSLGGVCVNVEHSHSNILDCGLIIRMKESRPQGVGLRARSGILMSKFGRGN